jgi:hypothetical protein
MNQSTIPPQAAQPQYAPQLGAPPTNTMAVLSLVFAFLFWPLAIVFGHVARTQIARTGERGRGLATAGLVLGYVGMSFLVLLMVIFAAAGSSVPVTGSSLTGATSAAMSDVSVTGCGNDGTAFSSATVKITNSTDRVQSYLVTVSLNDAAGNRLGEANGASNSVAPGQSATTKLLGGATTGVASCAVASVNRFPS